MLHHVLQLHDQNLCTDSSYSILSCMVFENTDHAKYIICTGYYFALLKYRKLLNFVYEPHTIIA